MKALNWTEPRVYTNPDGKPIRITVYDMDDGREVCSARLSTDDGPEHVERVKKEMVVIAQAGNLAHVVESVVLWDMSKSIGKRKPSPLYPSIVEDARATLIKAGI